MTEALTYETSRDGFPVVTCDRCGGAGTIRGYSHVLNGVCFKCNGSRWMYATPNVAKLASIWREELRAVARCAMGAYVSIKADGTRELVYGVNVGDVVRFDKSEPWRTVVAVRPTRRIIGHGIVGDGPTARFIHLTLLTLITFADGETVEGWGIQYERQADTARLTARRDELAAQARTAYERTLARRKR